MNIKKIKFLIPLAAFGMILASCGESNLPINYHDGDPIDIDTDFVPYSLPIDEVNFEDGQDPLNLIKGDSWTYKYSISPKKSSKEVLNWVSSDTTVCTVDKGVVTATGGGSATITVDGGEDAQFDPISLTVNVRVLIKDFSIEESFDLDYGEAKTVNPQFNPGDTTEQGLSYVIEDETIATVDASGIVTAKNKSGQTVLTVSSTSNPDISHTCTVKVTDKYNYVKKIDLSIEDDKLEVGKTAHLVYDVESEQGGDPTAPLTDIKYYTSTKDIIEVDENTGLVSAKEPGEAIVHAELYEARNGTSFIGKDYKFNVFENIATSLTIKDISKKVLNIDNKTYEPIKVEYEYETSPMNVTPSRPNVVISSDNPDVVTVSELGIVSIEGKGKARVTVSDLQYGVSDYFDVNVTILATAIEIVADSNTAYIGGAPVTITGKITPTGVSDNNVIYEITEGNEFVNAVYENNELKLTALKEGTVKVVAKTGGLTSEEKYITVDEPDAAFVAGHPYLVGNTKYKGGVATDNGKDSWFFAKYAYSFGDPSTVGNKTQYKVLAFQFNEGNEWKIKEGDQGWRNIGTKDVKPGYYQIDEGAFVTDAMCVENNNIHVNKKGYYDIYYNIYDRGTEDEFFKVYVGEHILFADKTSLELDHNDSDSIQIGGWVGSPTVTVVTGSEFIDVSEPDEHGKITVTSKEANGTALIKIEDENKLQPNPIEIGVKVEKIIKKDVYVNANGMMDSEGAKIVAHAWKDETHYKDYEFEQVSSGSYIYTAQINDQFDHILFARANPDTGEYYNKTEDLVFVEGKDMWTMTGYSESVLAGSWSKYNSEYNYNFDKDKEYIVGNKDFHDLEAQTDAPSWDNVDAAHELTWSEEKGQYELENVFFAKDTEFRFRSNVYYNAILEEDAGGNVDVNESGNFHIKQNGRYNIFLKEGKLYVTKNAGLSLDHDNIIVNKNAEYVVTVNNSHGDLTITGIDTTIAEATVDNNTKKITVTGKKYGDTSFTVTDGDGASATCQVHVAVPFENNKIYIVGDKDYSTGTSVDDGESWNNSVKAFLVGNKVVPAKGDPDNEISATITFAAGDKWRMRVGDEYPADNVKEESGALVGRQMHKDGFNFVVDVAGTYTIYIKTGSDAGHSIYIGEESTTRLIKLNPYSEVAGGDAWFALWAWKDSGAGSFYYGKPVLFPGDTTAKTLVVVPKECNMFKVLRMEKGIDPTSDWFDVDNYDSFKDHIWNASGDLEHPTKFDRWDLEYFYGDGSICVTNFN